MTKRCVGDPPRQTEDPLSPPCVAHFEGDNGGATFAGVTDEEIRVLWVQDCRLTVGDRGEENSCDDMVGNVYDLADPEQADQHVDLRNLARLQRYFNDRYQTYNRFVHFYAYVGTGAMTTETRRADLAQYMQQVDPFAVVTSRAFLGHEDVISEGVAAKGRMVFGSASGTRPRSFFQRFRGLVWSYPPSIESQAATFVDYVCRVVVPRPVSLSGDERATGQPRRLGLLSTSDERAENLIQFAALARSGVEECGGEFVADRTHPQHGKIHQSQGEDAAATYAPANIGDFQTNDVTTIIWAGGYETDMSKAAGRVGYFPEWIVAGDQFHESAEGGANQDQRVWAYATVVTPVVYVPDETQGGRDLCRDAHREADPKVGDQDLARACSNPAYVDARQFFTGIQVAGPQLTPASMEQGFRAIPAVASSSPLVPACYYEPGDYTCVKDAVIQHWDSDPQARGPGSTQPGCWRMLLDGTRFVSGGWPDGNVGEQREPDDVCNTYQFGINIL